MQRSLVGSEMFIRARLNAGLNAGIEDEPLLPIENAPSCWS
jgi:hypothetical protein